MVVVWGLKVNPPKEEEWVGYQKDIESDLQSTKAKLAALKEKHI